jgi:hypothetical protein
MRRVRSDPAEILAERSRDSLLGRSEFGQGAEIKSLPQVASAERQVASFGIKNRSSGVDASAGIALTLPDLFLSASHVRVEEAPPRARE